jgi:hypothetical protein
MGNIQPSAPIKTGNKFKRFGRGEVALQEYMAARAGQTDLETMAVTAVEQRYFLHAARLRTNLHIPRPLPAAIASAFHPSTLLNREGGLWPLAGAAEPWEAWGRWRPS